MKKSILNAAILVGCLFFNKQSIGQIERGKWISTIGISYNSYKGDKTTSSQTSSRTNISGNIEIGKFLSNKFEIGIGLSPFSYTTKEVYTSDSYYNETRNGIDYYLFSQMFKRIDEKFYYAPLIKFQFTAGKSIYKTKTPGFNETSSYFKNTSYGVEIQPLIFSYLLKKKFLLQTGLGKIGYGYSKSSTDAPNSDAAGSGNSFAFDFSPFITSIKISLLF